MVTSPRRPGCVVVGKRKESPGAGTLALPGDVGDLFEKAVFRRRRGRGRGRRGEVLAVLYALTVRLLACV